MGFVPSPVATIAQRGDGRGHDMREDADRPGWILLLLAGVLSLVWGLLVAL